MAISRMQEPRQLYGLGSIVKKAVRGVKKIVKSPVGKMALLGGLGFAANAGMLPGAFGKGFLTGKNAGLFARLKSGKGMLGGIGNLFRQGGDPTKGFSAGRMLLGGLGATAIAAPFFMGGGGEEEEEITDVIDPSGIRQSAVDFYRGTGGKNLAFMPQRQFVQPNFYAAEGGRAGYANGMIVEEDDEEEILRSQAGASRRMPRAFLQMGGGAAEQQAEQMLMAEYTKYRNKGGTMTFKQFVQAVMQQEQDQQTMMAADGGRIGKQEGGIMETEVAEELINMGGQEKDYRETGGFVDLGKKERADDVPARLSKNEFVFTADAVRNAGGGDIDKGAEVMQNLMDNLEQGGEISEESQGLEGAQAMYDQMQQLESRMI
tara:strand:- start:840 stop:1964 length:1125 start_codon:yes stop_codon:yes gene_type:complete